MMQYINRIKTVAVHTSAIVIMSIALGNAGTQFDVGGALVSGQKDKQNDAVTSATKKNVTAGNALVKYYGNYRIFPKLEVMLQENFDGILPLGYKKDSATGIYQPFTEKFVPSSNFASAGLRTDFYGDMQIMVRNLLYLDPVVLSPYYLSYMDRPPEDSTVQFSGIAFKRQSRTNVNLSILLPISTVETSVDLNYYTLNYSRIADGVNLNTFEQQVIDTKKKTDSDLLTDLGLKLKLPADLSVGGGFFMKQNFSGNAFMNLYQYRFQIQGDNKFPSDNKITWSTGVEQLMRSAEKTYPEGFAHAAEEHSFMVKPYYTLYLRDVYTLDWGLFLKGLVILDLGKDLYKQRYELSIRKAWQNESSIDIGYFNALGGLFPMQGAFFRSVYRPIDKLGFALNTKSVWEGPDRFLQKISYLKTNANAEIAFKFVTHSEIAIGGEYQFFDPGLKVSDEFSSRFNIMASLRGWF